MTYKAWTEGGTLKSVRHDYIDGPNGAVSVPAKVSGATWSTQEDGGYAPRLEVVPTGRSVAHCPPALPARCCGSMSLMTAK
ncbi:hypothetical protein MOV08_37315 [Streptomyces yunnanensis]|uniref:Uncharacterized protein n=1 Tax=Streptomyces yunnanensis TaxID=156453 RepID=A0ABY8AI13_9ACTN|nr:hypothetical protein [Streptomyces yunnanensis]WEB44404.1 hypothetical protein MOV08_37315 [Streptomyces yunnanensis]